MRLIDADALLDEVMDRHCNDCDRRKGIKNGKYRIIYSIGEAPCRACNVDDLKGEIEDAPTIQPDTDTVSRQKMINTVNNLRTRCDNDIDAYRDLMVAAIDALPPSPSRLNEIHCKDCRWRNDIGHWLGCPILNGDDDNYCSFAEPYKEGGAV